MIDTKNLKKVLSELGYIETKKDVYVKSYRDDMFYICVDIEKGMIAYPENSGMKIYRKTTCNFSENENFVVLECITSLFDRGYLPANIELEKPMPGGHDDTGGYCDIMVKDNKGRTFLLIECKKADEFDKYWKRTQADGSQLFRYYNSYRQAQALCLYTSDYSGRITRKSYIISMKDNEDYLASDSRLLSFRKVQEENGNKDDYFRVWKNTYQGDYAVSGIFEEGTEPFTIGCPERSVKDLVEIDGTSMQKKYSEFAAILRQHNIGSHENAFDKLVNLFLAKIVDETSNPDSLQFCWKGAAYDDYYSLQDRLQKLYKTGMEKFLGEEVAYVDQNQVSEAFHLFKNDPDATKAKIMQYFRELKFYTNSDFAFLDVHNEKLFFQNAAVLKEVVLSFENIRLRTDAGNQFLGDMFENFLDDGVKQNEGQYFTPLPIVKFMISSLPLEQMIKDSEDVIKAVDYACGAGHFLTEYAARIKPYIEKYHKAPIESYYAATYGIENEYRLSKVSKVSAFMYGQDEINIVYGNALSENSRIKEGTFSVLVSNPPYSVKGFFETLPEDDRNSYQLSSSISAPESNSDIETFFVEKAGRLLCDGGIAAIILPDRILTNSGIFSDTRKLIFREFEIISIVSLGDTTFSKTQTMTTILFLRKRNSNPRFSEHVKNRVNAWFNGNSTEDIVFKDDHYLSQYCGLCGIDPGDYIDWLKTGSLPQNDVFCEYKTAFKDSAEYRKTVRKKLTKKYTAKDKKNEIEKKLGLWIRDIEKEKLYYYILCSTNPPVVTVTAPTDKDKGVEFLGYKWSSAKGKEGIIYLDKKKRKSKIEDICTPLYDPDDYDNTDKVSSVIRTNFLRAEGGHTDCAAIPKKLRGYVSSHNLTDMIDFEKSCFDGSISIAKSFEMPESLFPVIPLGRIAPYVTERIDGAVLLKDSYVTTGSMLKDKAGIEPYDGNIPDKVTRFTKKDILVSNIRPNLKKIWFADREGGCSNDVMVFRTVLNDVLPEYLYLVLSQDLFFTFCMSSKKGVKMPRGNKTIIRNFPVPVPPIDRQQEMIESYKKRGKLPVLWKM